MKYGIIILAAGNSSRLGEAKQLLAYRDKSLLRKVVDEALSLSQAWTIVVTGAEKEAIEQELSTTGVTIAYNADWPQGMASSIRTGVLEMQRLQPQITACIISVCDQPFVTKEILLHLVEQHQETIRDIVASAYAGTGGVPVLFSKKYFAILLNLKGQEGAKKLLSIYQNEVLLVPFDKGEIDIDTREDYESLIASYSKSGEV